MCRNIKTLFNFDPLATDDEIQAASLQFVRKISGFTDPSKANEAAFNLAIMEVAADRPKSFGLAGNQCPASQSRRRNRASSP